MEQEKVITKVSGIHRWDNTIALSASRRKKDKYIPRNYDGSRAQKPAGIDEAVSKVIKDAAKKRVAKKFNNLDIPLEDILKGDLDVVQITINNCSQEEDRSKWLRGSQIIKKLRRRLEYIYGYGVGIIWREEFATRFNKPHIHALIFLPSFSRVKPVYKGREWENGKELLEFIGLNIIQKSQNVPRKSEHWIAKGNMVHRNSEKGYVAAISQTIQYFAKTGRYASKDDQASQSMDSDYIAYGGYTSGYSGLKRKDAVVISETEDDVTGEEIMDVFAREGWTMGVQDKDEFKALAGKACGRPSQVAPVVSGIMKADPESDWSILDFSADEGKNYEVVHVKKDGTPVIRF